MEISAQTVMELRKLTNVSMMACKKALEETNGDFDAAIDLLRKSGEAKAAKRADRETHEGRIRVLEENGRVIVASLLCETDFVAKNDDFNRILEELAQHISQVGVEAAKENIATGINDLVVKIGEKIAIGDCYIVEGANVATYLHSTQKLAAIVSLSGDDHELARKIAMHIAASPVKYLKPEDVDSAEIAREKEIWAAQLAQENKPENVMANILQGKEKKYREENALLTQMFVMEPDKTVAAILGDQTVLDFKKVAI